ncbi:MAG: hypothetical protein WCP01_13575 [Methylococcaceae bacterium]
MITTYYSNNTKEELRALLTDAESRSTNERIGSDDLMTIMHVLETQALAFKKQGGDRCLLRRVSERLEALSFQLITR